MNISWKGDFSNAPKAGVVEKQCGDMLFVRWSDGTLLVVPSFTVTERYGWRRW